jgi:hypothetical protein
MSTDRERIHDGWLLHVDYSRTLTAREKFSTFTVSTWLARKRIDATRSSRFMARDQFVKDFQWTITKKGMLKTEFHNLLYEDDFKWGLQGIILLTPLLILQILRFWQLIVLKVQYLSSWCDGYAGAVWCSWCTLEWLGYPYALMIGRAINSRERICVTSCYLTTKIPSALLVAVGWLQHTRYPRFRRGTFDYGATTSPNKRGRVGVRSFTRMHVSIPMLPICICYAAHAQKQHFNLNHKVWERLKEQIQDLGIDWIFDWHKIRGVQILIDHNIA